MRTCKPFMLASCVLWASLQITALPVPPFLQTDDWKSKLTSEERSAVSKPDSPNDRIKTYVRLTESRLRNARDHATREDYVAVDEEIKAYFALISDAGQFTKTSVPKRDKAHKTLETSLRDQLRSLESLQREVTVSHVELIQKTIKLANQIRRQSINLLLGDEGILSEKEPQ
jgi:hypothetical protein